MTKTSGFKNVIFTLILILFPLLCAELFLRFYLFGIKNQTSADFISRMTSNTFYQAFPYRIFGYKPVYDYVSTDKKRKHHINSEGLIGKEFTKDKAPDVYRIICLGASTTANFENSDDAHSYPGQLETLLSEALPGRKIEVLNAGVRGYNSAESLIYFSTKLIDYHPDLIIYYEGFNDLLPNSYPSFSSDYSHFRRPAWYGITHQTGFAEKILEHSVLYTFLRSKLTSYDQTQNVIAYSTLPPPSNPYASINMGSTAFNSPGFDAYERNLRNIIAIAQASKIKVVLATFSDIVEMDKRVQYSPELRALLASGMKSHNERVRKIWSENPEVIPVELDKELSGKPEYFFDFIHWNDAGSRKAAEILAAKITPQLDTKPAA